MNDERDVSAKKKKGKTLFFFFNSAPEVDNFTLNVIYVVLPEMTFHYGRLRRTFLHINTHG